MSLPPVPPGTIACHEVYAVAAARQFPAARRKLEQAGPELFSQWFIRALAAQVVQGAPFLLPAGMTAREGAIATRFVWEVEHCDGIVDERAGISVITRLAAVRGLPVVIDQLNWAVARLKEGAPLAFIRRRVTHAFAIAAGETPLYPEGWEGDFTE